MSNRNIKDGTDEKTDEKERDTQKTSIAASPIMFDMVNLDVIKAEVLKQQKYLKDSLCALNKTEKESANWELLQLEFDETFSIISSDQHHQCSQNSCVGNWSEQDMMKRDGKGVLLNKNESKNKLAISNIHGFNGGNEYDFNVYLTKLLCRAHEFNPYFQDDCRQLLNKEILGVPCQYSSAPVKTRQRAEIKAKTDYEHRDWPKTSCIMDCIRCSVVFDTIGDLLNDARKLKSMLYHHNANNWKPFGCIQGLVKIKNGFRNVPMNNNNESDLNDYNYADMKFLVVVEVNNKRLIGEIQLLLKLMVEVKKMGHGLYSIVRNKDYYHGLNNRLFKERNIMIRITNIILHKNINRLTNYLICLNNMERKVISKNQKYVQSLIDLQQWNQPNQLFVKYKLL